MLNENKKKKIQVSYILLIVPLFIIACFSYNIADYNNYLVFYNRINNGIFSGYQMEFGYILIEQIGGLFKLDFITFRAIYLAIAVLLITLSIAEYAENTKALVLCMYFIYPFMLDVVQMRHFMSVAIATYALKYLQEKSIKNGLKYCLAILIATSQHTVAFLYIIMLVVYRNIEIKKFFKRVVIIIGIEMIAATGLTSIGFVNRLYMLSSAAFLSFRGNGAIEIEKTDAVNKYYILMVVILIFLIVILFDNSKASYNEICNQTNGKFDLLYRISMLSLCYIPLININDNLARANRGLLLIIYTVFMTYAEKKSDRSMKGLVYRLFPITIALVCFYMFLSARSRIHYEYITLPLFQYNRLIEYLLGR